MRIPPRSAPIVTHDAVHAALETLQTTQREVIALTYFAGYSYRQVAERLGVPEGTIKNRIRTALALLRAALRDDYLAPADDEIVRGPTQSASEQLSRTGTVVP